VEPAAQDLLWNSMMVEDGGASSRIREFLHLLTRLVTRVEQYYVQSLINSASNAIGVFIEVGSL
jgi:hypothetical protein